MPATLHQLYDGQIKIWFDAASHRYFLDGKKIPHVTRILERGREPVDKYDRWYDKVKEAADIGTIVHRFAEECFKGLKPSLPTDPQARNAARAFLAWLNHHRVEVVHSEHVVYSKQYGYCGTLDAELIVDGVPTILDFKTASKVHADDKLQLAAYEQARREETGQTYRRIVLRLDKQTGTFEEKQLDDSPRNFDKFEGLLREYNRLRALRAQVRSELDSLRERVKRSIATNSLVY